MRNSVIPAELSRVASSGLNSPALQPSKHLATTRCCFGHAGQGTMTTSKLQAFGPVDGHQLHTEVGIGCGVGQCSQLVESGVKRRA